MAQQQQAKYVEFKNILIGEGQEESPTKHHVKQVSSPTFKSCLFRQESEESGSKPQRPLAKRPGQADHNILNLADEGQSQKPSRKAQVHVINAESDAASSPKQSRVKCDPNYYKQRGSEAASQAKTLKVQSPRPQDLTTADLFGSDPRESLRRPEVREFQPKQQYVLTEKEKTTPEQVMQAKRQHVPEPQNAAEAKAQSNSAFEAAQQNKLRNCQSGFTLDNEKASNPKPAPQQLQKDISAVSRDWMSANRGSKNHCQVNESAQFDRDYAYQKKLVDSHSTIFSSDTGANAPGKDRPQTATGGDAALRPGREGISRFYDQVNNDKRKQNRNFSDLLGHDAHAHESDTRPKQNYRLIPSNIQFYQMDSDYYKRYECPKDKNEASFPLKAREDVESEYLMQAGGNESRQQQVPVQGADVAEGGEQSVPRKAPSKQQQEQARLEEESEQNYSVRHALWKQKLEYSEKLGYKNVKVYRMDLKGLSDKFDVETFKKLCLQKGYHVVSLDLNTHLETHQPSGRGVLILRNKRKFPDPLQAVTQALQVHGLAVTKVREELGDMGNDVRPQSAAITDYKAKLSKKPPTKFGEGKSRPKDQAQDQGEARKEEAQSQKPKPATRLSEKPASTAKSAKPQPEQGKASQAGGRPKLSQVKSEQQLKGHPPKQKSTAVTAVKERAAGSSTQAQLKSHKPKGAEKGVQSQKSQAQAKMREIEKKERELKEKERSMQQLEEKIQQQSSQIKQ